MANFGVDLIASPINETYLTALLLFEPPTKRTYLNGEYFNPAGMIVQAIYNNNTRKNITYPADYTYTPTGALTDSDTAITISYTEGDITKTLSVAITVAATLTGIEITTMPSKTVYYFNEQPDYVGMVVSATYSNGTSMPVTSWVAPTTALTTLGSVGLTVSYTENGVTYTADVPVTVQPKVIANVPSQNGTLTYTGSSQTPVWDDYNSEELTIGGTTNGANAGEYEATFTPKYGYCWADTTTTAKTVTWEIDRAKIASVPTQSGTLTYNGSPLTPTWNNYNATQLAIGGDTSATAAGTYTVTFTPTDNYCWFDDTTEGKQATWSVEQAVLEVPTQQGILTYNGQTLTPAWSNNSINFCTVEGTQSSVNAGSFTLTLTPQDNFKWADGTTTAKQVTWSIGRAVLQVPQQSGALTYNKVEQGPTLSNNSANYCEVGGTAAATNAGTYTMTLTPNSNYEWSDNSTGGKDITWVIGKATPTLTFSPESLSLTSANPTQSLFVIYSDDSIDYFTSNFPDETSVTPIYDEEADAIRYDITGLKTCTSTFFVYMNPNPNYVQVDGECPINIQLKPPSRLPEGYTEVEYIHNENFGYNQSIPFGGSSLTAKQTRVELVASDDLVGVSSTSTAGSFWGYYPSNTISLYITKIFSNSTTNKNTYRLVTRNSAGSLKSVTFSIADIPTIDNKLFMSVDMSGISGYNFKINDVQGSTDALGSTYDYAAIFGYRGSSGVSSKSNYKLYSLQYYNSATNELYADFVPCVDSNDEAGLYDIVRNKFYKSEATGKPFLAPYQSGGGVIPEPEYPDTLEECTWEEISEISASGQAAKHFSVGDTKTIILNGTIGTEYVFNELALKVFIIQIDNNGITFGTFKTVDDKDVFLCLSEATSYIGSKIPNLNHWGNQMTTSTAYATYSFGGWKRCDLRYDILGSTDVPPDGYGAKTAYGQVGYDATENCAINPVPNTLMSCLPEDLRAVMKPMTIYSDNVGGGFVVSNVSSSIDYLPPLAEFEVFGERRYANPAEQNFQIQYQYFKNVNDLEKHPHDYPNARRSAWGLRSCIPTGSASLTVGSTNYCSIAYGALSAPKNSTACSLAPIFLV